MTITEANSKIIGATKRQPFTLGASAPAFVMRLLVVCILTSLLMAASRVSIGAIGQGLALALVGVGVFISFRLLNFPVLTVDG